jgi:hypothetical protein
MTKTSRAYASLIKFFTFLKRYNARKFESSNVSQKHQLKAHLGLLVFTPMSSSTKVDGFLLQCSFECA